MNFKYAVPNTTLSEFKRILSLVKLITISSNLNDYIDIQRLCYPLKLLLVYSILNIIQYTLIILIHYQITFFVEQRQAL